MNYTLKYVKSTDGILSGYLVEMPSVIAQGRSFTELKTNIKLVFDSVLDVLKEEGLKAPSIQGWEDSKIILIKI